MPAVAADAVEDGEAPAPAKRGKKKLIVLLAVVLLAVGGAGGGAAWFVKHKRAQAEAAAAELGEGGEASEAEPAPEREVSRTPPTFLPLDNFVVNLADRDIERFAQIGITLELEDPQAADMLKAYMPAVRNGILMVLAHKTSQQLLGRAGKEALAAEIRREAVRPLGIELDADGNVEGAGADDPPAPVRQVHFSSFIIQ